MGGKGDPRGRPGWGVHARSTNRLRQRLDWDRTGDLRLTMDGKGVLCFGVSRVCRLSAPGGSGLDRILEPSARTPRKPTEEAPGHEWSLPCRIKPRSAAIEVGSGARRRSSVGQSTCMVSRGSPVRIRSSASFRSRAVPRVEGCRASTPLLLLRAPHLKTRCDTGCALSSVLERYTCTTRSPPTRSTGPKSSSWVTTGTPWASAVAAIQRSLTFSRRLFLARWTRSTAHDRATASSIGICSMSAMDSSVASRRARTSRSSAANTPACSSATVTGEIAASCGSASLSSGRPVSLAMKTLVSSSPRCGACSGDWAKVPGGLARQTGEVTS